MLLTLDTSLCSVACLLLTSHRLLLRAVIRSHSLDHRKHTHTHTVSHAQIYTQKTRTLSVPIAGLSSPVSSRFFPAIEVAFSPAWERLGFPGLSGQTGGWVKILSTIQASHGPAFLYCLSIIRLQSTAILTGSPFSPHSFHPLKLLLHLPSAVCFSFPMSHLKFP